jgi:hypothetical protein
MSSTFSLTGDKLLVDLSLVPADGLEPGTMIAVLNCRDLHNFVGPLGLRIRPKEKPYIITGNRLTRTFETNQAQEFVVAGTSRTSSVSRVIPLFDAFVDLMSRSNYSPERLLIRREAPGSTEFTESTARSTTVRSRKIVFDEEVCWCMYSSNSAWLSFGSYARVYPSTYSKKSGNWIVIFLSTADVHAAAEIRSFGDTFVYCFGVDNIKDIDGREVERPWVQIQKMYWHDLRNITPPKPEQRRSFDYYTVHSGDIPNAGLYRFEKMGEIVYEKRTYYVNELDLHPVTPRLPTPLAQVEEAESTGKVPPNMTSRPS